ncbi:MAG: hypothetical protein ACR2NH_02095 [Solirubrobacteraceae bacterium]
MPFYPLPEEATGSLVYATVADLQSYIEGGTTLDAAALERVLERAERDVDNLLGDYDRDPDTDRKLAPDTLPAHQQRALRRATCAQAEYRIAMGEQFFIEDQFQFVAGPDFQRRGRLGYVGQRVLGELADSGFKMAVPVA